MKIDLTKSLDDTPLGFGKYKGLTPRILLDRDPGYLVWMWDTFDDPPMTKELYEEALENCPDTDEVETEQDVLDFMHDTNSRR